MSFLIQKSARRGVKYVADTGSDTRIKAYRRKDSNMKRDFLTGLGIEKEVIDKIMDEHGKDIEKQKQALTTAETDRDAYKQQLDDVNTKLKAFNGVDVDSLKGEVEKLKTDMAQKESEFQTQLSERELNALLEVEIMAAKGKNAKLIRAALDMDSLRGSKNQKEDVSAALKALSETDAYLFGESETTGARVSTGGAHNPDGGSKPEPTNLKEALTEHYDTKGE